MLVSWITNSRVQVRMPTLDPGIGRTIHGCLSFAPARQGLNDQIGQFCWQKEPDLGRMTPTG